MRNILLTISYDGTDFCGWQRQDFSDKKKPVRTVQGEIEKALEKIHKQHINLNGSGRTDSGVHAKAQAANFFSPVDSIPAEKYILALNSLLPQDIRISDSKEVSPDFDSRRSATSRVYRYFFKFGQPPFAWETRYSWAIKEKPDFKRLNEMANYLKGEIDCATFAAAGDQSKSTFRYLENAFFVQTEEDSAYFQIEANAFLWKMVRSIMGSLIFFEKSDKDPSYFKTVLDSHQRKMAGPTAPSQGLFLWEIKFDGIRRHI